MAYFNTTNQSGVQLSLFKEAAQKQETQVLEFFKVFKSMTPSQVWKYFSADGTQSAPITSIRRAITNLYNDGFLVKTDQKVPGLYNRPEHIYRISLDKESC